MIDVTNKTTRLSLREVAELTGKDVATIFAWCRSTDYKGRPKRFLETAMLGGNRYTTPGALLQFQQQEPPHRAPRIKQEQQPVVSEKEAYYLKKLRDEFGVKV